MMTAVYYLQGNRRNAKKEEPPSPQPGGYAALLEYGDTQIEWFYG
jgi:hypothetical protein